jgi:hypothetical protein
MKKTRIYDLPRYHEQSFNWLSWRNGTIFSLLTVEIEPFPSKTIGLS